MNGGSETSQRDPRRYRSPSRRPQGPALAAGALGVWLSASLLPTAAAAPARPATPAPTVILLSARRHKPLARRAQSAIQAQLGTTPTRVEVRWLHRPTSVRRADREGALARQLARHPHVVAVVWFELAVQAQVHILVSHCGRLRLLVRNLESIHARGRVESLAIIVGASARAALVGAHHRCPVTPSYRPPALPRHPRPRPSPSSLRRWTLDAAFATDFLYEDTSFTSSLGTHAFASGLALGALSGRVSLGYLAAPRWRLGASLQLGQTPSDSAVLSWALLATATYYLTGPPRGAFSAYLGLEAGLGQVHGSLLTYHPTDYYLVRDTWEHRLAIAGARAGLRLGPKAWGWFVEFAAGLVFPHQTTVRLQLATGVRLRL